MDSLRSAPQLRRIAAAFGALVLVGGIIATAPGTARASDTIISLAGTPVAPSQGELDLVDSAVEYDTGPDRAVVSSSGSATEFAAVTDPGAFQGDEFLHMSLYGADVQYDARDCGIYWLSVEQTVTSNGPSVSSVFIMLVDAANNEIEMVGDQGPAVGQSAVLSEEFPVSPEMLQSGVPFRYGAFTGSKQEENIAGLGYTFGEPTFSLIEDDALCAFTDAATDVVLDGVPTEATESIWGFFVSILEQDMGAGAISAASTVSPTDFPEESGYPFGGGILARMAFHGSTISYDAQECGLYTLTVTIDQTSNGPWASYRFLNLVDDASQTLAGDGGEAPAVGETAHYEVGPVPVDAAQLNAGLTFGYGTLTGTNFGFAAGAGSTFSLPEITLTEDLSGCETATTSTVATTAKKAATTTVATTAKPAAVTVPPKPVASSPKTSTTMPATTATVAPEVVSVPNAERFELSSPDSVAAPGGTVEVKGSGYAPLSEVVVTYGDDILGVATTDSNGDYTLSVTLPKDATNRIELTSLGVDSDGEIVVEVLGINVVAPAASTMGSPPLRLASVADDALVAAGASAAEPSDATGLGLVGLAGVFAVAFLSVAFVSRLRSSRS